jgi:hypothetical protein
MASATRGDTLPVMPSKARHLILFVIPAKAGIQKEMDPHFHGDDKKAVIPAISLCHSRESGNP